MIKKATIFDLYNLDVSTIDLTKDYIVDTNVLYKVYYSKYPPNQLDGQKYSKFIEFLLEKNVSLYTTTYNIAELFYLIEKAEYECYLEDNKLTKKAFSSKDFRKLTKQKEDIQTELDLVLLQISSMFEVEEISTKLNILQSFADNYKYIYCDNYDYSVISHFQEQGKVDFISHDIDFAYTSGINLYTMNKKAIV